MRKCEDCSDGSCVNCHCDAQTAKLAKARQRITELEAQVIASETVSRGEYDAMVKQRDTMREELKAARHLLVETLPWLRTYDEEADELSWLIDAIEALQPFRA